MRWFQGILSLQTHYQWCSGCGGLLSCISYWFWKVRLECAFVFTWSAEWCNLCGWSWVSKFADRANWSAGPISALSHAAWSNSLFTVHVIVMQLACSCCVFWSFWNGKVTVHSAFGWKTSREKSWSIRSYCCGNCSITRSCHNSWYCSGIIDEPH